jgi:hypothetical protein
MLQTNITAFAFISFVVLGHAVSSADAWMVTKHHRSETSSSSSSSSPSSSFKTYGRPSIALHQSSSGSSSTSTTAAANTNEQKGYTEIIGNGRIGSVLAQGVTANNCKVLGRHDKIDPMNVGQPIYIATRNDALATIIDNCPQERKSDLVFLQNGYLDKLLESKGLINNTQVLLYLSVPSKGAIPVTGIHAISFQQCLQSINMKCNIVNPTLYRPAMFEKLMYVFLFISCIYID